jgi:release factor glutamine methyltransferase
MEEVVAALARAGCVAAREEATELLAAAGDVTGPVDALVARRVEGEPLAWITGSTAFCGLRLQIHPGVYVPRWQSEAMARRAVDALPGTGVAVDLCTGSGAVAAVLAGSRPAATVVATDVDPAAVACARANGVDARLGDLADPLPRTLLGRVDVMTAVVPYVPTESMHLLPRDTLAFEPPAALDGGRHGTSVLGRVIDCAPRWLRPGGTLVLEIGGDQQGPVTTRLTAAGLDVVDVLTDEEDDPRAMVAVLPADCVTRGPDLRARRPPLRG